MLLDQILVLLAKVALALIGIFVALMGLLVVTRARRPFPIDGAWELGDAGWETVSDRAGWKRSNQELEREGWAALGTSRRGGAALAAWLSPCRKVVAIVLARSGFDAVTMTSLGAGGERVRTVNQPVGHLPTSPRGQLLWKATPAAMHRAHVAAFGEGARELEPDGAIAALRASSERAIDALVPTGWLAWAGEGRASAMFTWRGAVASVRTDQRLAELARRARGAAVALPPAPWRPWRVAIVIAGAILCSGVLYLGWARPARVCRPAPIAIAAPVTEGRPALAWADAVVLDGQPFALRQIVAGELVLSSGQLVIADSDEGLAAPLAVELPAGSYPVTTCLVGEQVAFARIVLTGTRPIHWLASGTEIESAAYRIHSGSVVFRDLTAARGRGDARFAIDRVGSFPVYVGYDAEGRVAAVVTQLLPVVPF